MPRHRRRPGLSRHLLPAALGALVLSGVGSVLVGTLFSPTSAGAIGAVEGISEGPDTAAFLRPAATMPEPPPAAVAGPASALAGSAQGALWLDQLGPAAATTWLAPAAGLTGYQWPLPHGRITLPFGPTKWGSRVVDGELFHDGLDLATFCGDRVVAAHDGVVMAASRQYDTAMGWVGDLQPYLDRLDAKSLWSTLPIVVVIDDGNGYRSMYAHLSKAVVKKGARVSAGDLIGYEGKTGRASGCHVHYGLFSPLERSRFGIDPGLVERMKLPAWELARVDPLLVLPERKVDHRGKPSREPVGAMKAPLSGE